MEVFFRAIGEVFGAELYNLDTVFHGVQTKVKITSEDEILFKNLGPVIDVGRYHSWVVKDQFPDCLEITSVDENNQIMALRHRDYDVKGVQFHPEKAMYEWGIPFGPLLHSPQSISMSSYLAMFFATEARKSHHSAYNRS